jgi:hypothetical protein
MHNNKVTYYLINNQIGALSRKVNGLKGDKVSIITYSLNMRLVKNEAGHIFWVNVNNLSEAPISKDTTNEQTYTDTKGRKKRV